MKQHFFLPLYRDFVLQMLQQPYTIVGIDGFSLFKIVEYRRYNIASFIQNAVSHKPIVRQLSNFLKVGGMDLILVLSSHRNDMNFSSGLLIFLMLALYFISSGSDPEALSYILSKHEAAEEIKGQLPLKSDLVLKIIRGRTTG